MSFRFNAFVVVFSFLIILGSQVQATVASRAQTDQVSRNLLNYIVQEKGGWAGTDAPKVDKVRDIIVNDTLLGRCYDIAPAGYIVVPILMEESPIKAYSDESPLNLDDPESFGGIIKAVLIHQARIYISANGSLEAAQVSKGRPVFDPSGRQQWDQFLLDDNAFKAQLADKAVLDANDVGPLMTSRWDQGYPYNSICPIGDGGRTVVGCVATAASQIMHYYQWPPEGQGTKNYYWAGDQSCNGSSPGETLTADYNDSYDWDNMPDQCLGGCDADQMAALSELCYEVGIAFDMDYGVCGSGSYMSNSAAVYHNYFRYMNTVQERDRTDFSLYDWSNMIRQEIEANRLIQYQIYSHSIVCDGWRQVLGLDQVHMNYGWSDSHNTWYTVDNLYCPWDGCATYWEWMLTGIEPDRGVMFTMDTTWGQVPFDVSFSGVTTLSPDQWIWSFGDGDSATVQSPLHTYSQPGRFDVAACVVAGTDTSVYNRTNCVISLADTMISGTVTGAPGDLVEVPIYVNNTVPLSKIKIPVEYGQGSMNISLESYTKEGCRTAYFDTLALIHSDPWGQRATFTLYNNQPSTPDLAPGSGPVLKLYFRISSGANASQSAPIMVGGYLTQLPTFYWDILNYSPIYEVGSITLPYMCGDAASDGAVNLVDILYLIDFIYSSPRGPAPEPMASGDVNGDNQVNLLDVLYLIDFVYGDPPGPAPACP